jgi:hypothetical protein
MHRLLLTISLSLFLYYDTVAQLRPHGTGVTDSINEKTVNPFSKYLPGYEGLFSKKISIETFTSASATVFNHSLINNDLLTSDRFLGFSNHASLGMDVFGVPFSISYTVGDSANGLIKKDSAGDVQLTCILLPEERQEGHDSADVVRFKITMTTEREKVTDSMMSGTIGGSVVSAHIGGNGGVYWDDKDGTLNLNLGGNIGFGVGGKADVRLSIPFRNWAKNVANGWLYLIK